MKVFILRGLPGAGKDFWIQKHAAELGVPPIVFSTDDYFMQEGVYRFDPALLGQHHNRCLREFTRFVSNVAASNNSAVYVSNTNVRCFEISPYYRVAEAFGHEPEVVHVQASVEDCKRRNVHGVPPETIEKMFLSLEALPPFWRHRFV